MPSRLTSVPLFAAASLPIALPTVSASPSHRAGRRRSGMPGRARHRSARPRRASRHPPGRGLRRPRSRSAAARRSSSPAMCARPPHRATAPHRRRSGLPPRDRASARRPCRRAPQHAPAPCTSAMRTAGSGCASGRRDDVERKRQQAVAGQDRGRLVERLVGGRPAPPQVVVVHRRQVVVHQRIAVHALQRGADHRAPGSAARRTARRLSTTRNGRNRLPPPRLA